MKVLVSVVMPVYNGEKYLKQSINSILSQSFKEFEFIIVDDCSNDNTLSILKSIDDPRVRIVRNKYNLGLSSSLNKGIELSLGKYIARQDDDDISEKYRLQKQVDFMEKAQEVDAVFCRYVFCDILGKISNSESKFYNTKDQIKEALKSKKDPVAHGSAMIRTKSLIKIGCYNTKFIFSQDYELWNRMMEEGLNIQMINYIGYHYRVFPDINKKVWQKKYAILVDNRKYIGNTEFLRRTGELYSQVIENMKINNNINPIYQIFTNYLGSIKLRLFFLFKKK
jgi:glycosyltransferase involved in cell wall biosynthesis